MNNKTFIKINLIGLVLFFILRSAIMNLNMFIQDIIFLFEIIVVLIILLKFLFKKHRTKKNLILSSAHISGIISIIFIVGHLATILFLNTIHYKTINVYKTHIEDIPTADRVSGSWIIRDIEFKKILTKNEKEILLNNFRKLSPCQYQSGYCYIELGGMLKNYGGYCLKISESEDREVLGFGFTRVGWSMPLIGKWTYYNK
jgi:hypothetical protein